MNSPDVLIKPRSLWRRKLFWLLLVIGLTGAGAVVTLKVLGKPQDAKAAEVSEKEKHDIAALENIKSEVEKRVTSLKEKRLFEEWLKMRKKNSKIVIKDSSI